MGFTVVHRDGSVRADPPLSAIPELLAEVADGEGAVAVRHATGWVMRVHGDGIVEFVNEVESAIGPLHRGPLPGPVLTELLQGVAVGSLYETLEHEWVRGARPPHPA